METAFFMQELEYFVVYKPFNMLTQFTAEGDHQTLADLAFTFNKDVYPVGRLDYNSEGLLILTNDKSMNQQLLLPRNKVSKTYYAQVEGEATPSQIQKLNYGVEINVKGKIHQTDSAEVLTIETPILPERNPPIRFRANKPTTWLSITIGEGKNRQVRKMTAAINLPTLRLVRWSIGALSVKDLNPGEVQAITLDELKKLVGI